MFLNAIINKDLFAAQKWNGKGTIADSSFTEALKQSDPDL